jgi:hypothetical protein
MDDERSRTVVEILEQVADRAVSKNEFLIALEAARQAWQEALTLPVKACATHAAASLTDPRDAVASVLCAAHLAESKTLQQVMADQCSFLRDLFGNPFRQTAIDPSWLRWNEGIVQRMARSIYDDRVFDRLPILADALEEAGCTNADILNHCRHPSEHVRGCWVIDLLLGKG